MQLSELIERAEAIAGGTRKLGAALNANPSHISAWKAGTRHCPDEKLLAMVRLCGLPTERTLGAIVLARLGKLAKTSLAGVVAIMLTLGARDDAAASVGRLATDHDV